MSVDWSKRPVAGEPVFMLLGRDTQAPGLLHIWAYEREQGIAEGRFPESDRAIVADVLRLATQMIEWRQRNDGAWREKNPELPLATEPVPLCDCELVMPGHPEEARLCDRCKRDGEQASVGTVGAIAALNSYVATMPAPRGAPPETAKADVVVDALGGVVRLLPDDFAINLHKPRTADTADAASAMRSGPDYPEL